MKIFTPQDGRDPMRSLARSGMIAAMYVALTLIFHAISFGPVQFRISEALMLLPALTTDAIPGLFIGCLLANLLGGGLWYDVVFGSAATLIAAIFAYKWRKTPALSAFSAVLFNALIVGPVVYFAFVHAPGGAILWPALLATAGSVALGELVVCCVLGLPLYYALKRLPERVLK